MFDESSSYWSTKKEILLDLKGFKDELQFARIQLCLGEDVVDEKLKPLGKLVYIKVNLVKQQHKSHLENQEARRSQFQNMSMLLY